MNSSEVPGEVIPMLNVYSYTVPVEDPAAIGQSQYDATGEVEAEDEDQAELKVCEDIIERGLRADFSFNSRGITLRKQED
jgi:hypothetical protein